MTPTDEHVGCEICWPPTPDRAWDALSLLTTEAELIDESHFMVKLRSCPACRQRFVSAFAETIDWENGQDPQSWCVLPITLDESKNLPLSDAELVSHLHALAPDLRSLCHDFADTPRSFWSHGLVSRGSCCGRGPRGGRSPRRK